MAHQREFVHEADVHRAERVLEQLDHFGDARRAHRHDLVHHLAVESHRRAGAVFIDAADHLRNVLGLELRVARVDALGREREIEIDARLQALGGQRRLHDFDRRARAIGLTRAQWSVLSHLARYQGVNQAALADLMELQPLQTRVNNSHIDV